MAAAAARKASGNRAVRVRPKSGTSGGRSAGRTRISRARCRPGGGTSDGVSRGPVSGHDQPRGFTDQAIGTGTGSNRFFQLAKTYTSGAQSWTRAIVKPVGGTVRVALGGVEQLSGWTVDTTTGIVSFTSAPGSGVAVTAGFEFDVPVRFDSDTLDVTLDVERLGSITSIPLVEIRR